MKLHQLSLSLFFQKIQFLEAKLGESSIASSPDLQEQYNLYASRLALAAKIRAINKQINQTQFVIQLDELKSRRRVLRRLGYVTDAGVITLKGRVACEISTGDEILLTEMMFQGVFNELTVEQCVSLLSCFTFQEKVRLIAMNSILYTFTQ